MDGEGQEAVNFRLKDQTKVSPSDPFFITGPDRCGTTLLRRLIVEKSGAVIPPENYSLEASGRFRSISQQDWTLSCRLLIGEVQQDSQQNEVFGMDAATAISLLSSIPAEHRTIARLISGMPFMPSTRPMWVSRASVAGATRRH